MNKIREIMEGILGYEARGQDAVEDKAQVELYQALCKLFVGELQSLKHNNMASDLIEKRIDAKIKEYGGEK